MFCLFIAGQIVASAGLQGGSVITYDGMIMFFKQACLTSYNKLSVQNLGFSLRRIANFK